MFLYVGIYKVKYLEVKVHHVCNLLSNTAGIKKICVYIKKREREREYK